MPRYPVRPFYHPKQILASMPFAYPFFFMITATAVLFPFRYKISRYYERASNVRPQGLKGKAVRLYREMERMQRREMTFKGNPVYEENPGTRMALPVEMRAINTGMTDYEFQYWESHQKDVMRARKLQQEIEDLKARVAAPAK